jgi:hypothetical protein
METGEWIDFGHLMILQQCSLPGATAKAGFSTWGGSRVPADIRGAGKARRLTR